MPLTVPVPAETINPAPVTFTPPPLVISDASMVAALEAEGYAVAAPTPTPTPTPTTGHPLGAWYPGGAGNPAGQKSLAATYSPNLKQLMCDGTVQDTWPDVDNSESWLAGLEKPAVMFPVPLCLTGQTLAQAWSANAGVFTTIGKDLIAAGVVASESIIRLGHEFSGPWYPWYIGADPANWLKCFQRASLELKALGFKVFWCTAINSQPFSNNKGMALADGYPGDQYVDIIGGDLYAEAYAPLGNNSPANASKVWAEILAGPWGLTATIAFAEAHNKPFGYGELGLATTNDNAGTGDDTTFLPNALNTAKACTSGFAVVEYFSATHGEAGRIASDIGEFPNAAAGAKAAFGAL